MNWYQLDVQRIFQQLKTRPDGLTTDEARRRLEQYGPNVFGEEAAIGKLKILLHQFQSPLIYILLISAAVTVLLGELSDAGVILIVVVLNAIVGFVQEVKAEQSVKA